MGVGARRVESRLCDGRVLCWILLSGRLQCSCGMKEIVGEGFWMLVSEVVLARMTVILKMEIVIFQGM